MTMGNSDDENGEICLTENTQGIPLPPCAGPGDMTGIHVVVQVADADLPKEIMPYRHTFRWILHNGFQALETLLVKILPVNRAWQHKYHSLSSTTYLQSSVWHGRNFLISFLSLACNNYIVI